MLWQLGEEGDCSLSHHYLTVIILILSRGELKALIPFLPKSRGEVGRGGAAGGKDRGERGTAMGERTGGRM